MNETITMTCLCGTDHTFPAETYTGTCAGCGLGLVRGDAPLDAVRAEVEDRDDCDDEPYDIDSDEGYDPYTGGPESDGYDTGYDDYPGVGYDD